MAIRRALAVGVMEKGPVTCGLMESACVYYSERRQNRRYDFDKISANMPTLIHEA